MKNTTAILLVAAFAGSAAAQGEPIDLYTITANNASGQSSMTIRSDTPGLVTNPDGSLSWELAGPMEFANGAVWQEGSILISGLDGASGANSATAPSIALTFAVSASSVATTFTITSALTTFTTIPLAGAAATAGVTVTQDPIFGGTATGTGLVGAGDFYGAFLNGTPTSGTLFADLVAGPLTTTTTTVLSEDTGAGFIPVGSVSSISAQFHFTLSADDLASGTSSFALIDLIPTPGSAGVLALAGLFASRRRR